MADEQEDQRDTPRVCEACGGSSDNECQWCNDGFQTVSQQGDWRRFRRRVSQISGTYSMAQGMAQDLVEMLERSQNEEAAALAAEGREALDKWLGSDSSTPEREEANRVLMAFHSRALQYIVKGK